MEMQSVLDRSQDSLKIEKAKQEVATNFRLRQQWLFTRMAFLALAGIGALLFFRGLLVQSKLKEQLFYEKAE